MQRKTLYIIIGSILVIVLGVFAAYLISGGRGQSAAPEAPAATNPFPFGDLIDRFAGRRDDIRTRDDSTAPTRGKPGQPIQIVDVPQAGFGLVSRAGQTALRYIARETGHIFEYTPDAGSVRLSNQTIPRIIGAEWADDGLRMLLARRESDGSIRMVRGTLEPAKTESDDPAGKPAPYTLNGQTLPASIVSAVLSPDSRDIALLEYIGKEAHISTLAFNENESVRLFASPHLAWNLDWNAANEISLATRPSPYYLGVSYILDIQSRGLSRRAEGVALSLKLGSDAGSSISTSIENGRPATIFRDHAVSKTIVLPFTTYPQEKCIYISDDQAICAAPSDIELFDYPHGWYQGRISYADDLWLINRTGGSALSLYNTGGDTLSLDMINLQYNAETKTVYFENKRDHTVWMLPVTI